MTDSSHKKSKDKRYHPDSVLCDTNLITAPPADFPGDEDAIDRLLLNTGFDADNEEESVNDWDAEIREPFFSATAEDIVTSETAGTDVTAPIMLDIEENLKQEDLIGNLEAEAKKAKILACAALGVAVTAVIAAVFLAITAYKAQAEINRLSDLVSLIEEDLSGFSEKNNSNASDRNDSSFEPSSQAPEVDSTEADASRPILAKANPTAPDRTDESGKTRPESAPEPTQAKPGWFVNLVAFNQRSDAEQQASDFMAKGVRTEIVEVALNQATWYRLRVGGFINKEQAAAYAEKIKKPLQLTSIWLAGG